jgi:hypothetical protein
LCTFKERQEGKEEGGRTLEQETKRDHEKLLKKAGEYEIQRELVTKRESES